MLHRTVYAFFVLFIAGIIFAGCHASRHVGEGEVLLDHNKFVTNHRSINTYDLEAICKQKANRRFGPAFGPRIFLYVHNSVNPLRAQRKSIRKQMRINGRNMRRMRKGKDPLAYKPTWREHLMYTIGEPPVILDTSKARKTKEQIQLHLYKKGFFFNKTELTYEIDSIKKRGQAVYTVTGPQNYTIGSFTFSDKNARLDTIVKMGLWENNKGKKQWLTKIREGEPFDMYLLDKERERITAYLQDLGFWKFTKDLIIFNADTTQENHRVAVQMSIKPWLEPSADQPDTLIETHHPQFKVNEVNFIMDYHPKEGKGMVRKKHVHNGPDGQPHHFFYKDTFDVDLDLLIFSTFLRPTKFWKAKYVTRSYRRLSEILLYQSVNITIEEADLAPNHKGSHRLVNVTYYLTPAVRKSLGFEISGTHQGGFPGVQEDIHYTLKNTFGAGEEMAIRVKGGFEAQQTITGTVARNNGDLITESSFLSAFNTLEFGPEISITMPYIGPTPKKMRYGFSRSAMPFSTIKGGYNFQKHTDYTRSIIHGSLGLFFYQEKDKTNTFTPFSISSVAVNRSAGLDAFLSRQNNIFLNASYQDHLIFAANVSTTYDSDFDDSHINRKIHTWGKLSGEFAYNPTFTKSSHIGQLASEYILLGAEGKFIYRFNKRKQWASRGAIGYGYTGPATDALPFEKSLFAGGANTLRAWKTRSVGPGSYYDTVPNFDKIGDIKIEFSTEYRFDFISIVELALFADAGNIWLAKNDPSREKGQWKLHSFYKQFALGGGIGARLDLTFFIIRLDLGIPLRTPALPRGEQWIGQPKSPSYRGYKHNAILNLGIGYPF